MDTARHQSLSLPLPDQNVAARRKKFRFKIPGSASQKKIVSLLLILAVLLGILVPLWKHPIPPDGKPHDLWVHDYKQNKVAEGVYELTGREPIKQELAGAKGSSDLRLKENKNAITMANGTDNEVYRWEVTLPSGTVFSFGRQQTVGIEPVVKVTDKNGLYVRYYPTSVTLSGSKDSNSPPTAQSDMKLVTPQVKGNVISWGIAEGITARYTMQQDGVKADYIVQSKQHLPTGKLDFRIEHSEKLTPEMLPDGDIIWLNGADEVFTFPKPVILEAKSKEQRAKNSEWDGKYMLRDMGDSSKTLSIVLPEERFANAIFPLTIDPQVIDASLAATGTAYGNGRKLIRDGWGNLVAVFDGNGSADDVWYRSYNATAWTDAGITLTGDNDALNPAIDIDGSGNIHVSFTDDSIDEMYYVKLTVARDGSNAISGITKGSEKLLDQNGVANRSSLIVANKGAGPGKEKIVIGYSSNTTNRGEFRIMQCDVSDDCTVAANWKNVSEEKNGNGVCSDTDGSGNRGLPNTGSCKGVTDRVFNTATTTTHHGVLIQMPMQQKRTPASAMKYQSSTYTTLTDALDGNTGTAADVSSLNDATDYIYIGDSRPFSKITFDITNTNTSFSDLVLEYWNGSTWISDVNVEDRTAVQADPLEVVFSEDGSMLFDQASDWAITSVNGVTRYWVRISMDLDASVSVAEITVNDRNSGALVAIGGSAGTLDLRAAYAPWDDVNNDRWENNPSYVALPWTQDIGGASSALADKGGSWTAYPNFPLTATVDTVNNRLYVAYILDNVVAGSDIIVVASLGINKNPIFIASWDDASFPTGITEASDLVVSITADQGNIYLFYILDPDTNGIVYRTCIPSGGGNGNFCDVLDDWGSEQTLVNFASTSQEPTHPQAVVSKAFGDTTAIDVIYTNIIASPTVNYERKFIDSADRTVSVAASDDDTYHADCDDGIDSQFTSLAMPLGFVAEGEVFDCGTGGRYHAGFRFPSVSVAQGAQIASAYLDVSVTSVNDVTGMVPFTVYGEDVDDAAVFPDHSGCTAPCSGAVAERTRTTNTVSQSLDPTTTRYRLDITNIVQEIVCRGAANAQPCVGDFNSSGSWTSGNDLALLLIAEQTDGTSNYFYLEDFDTTLISLKPTLQINLGSTGKKYSMGSATQLASGSASLAYSDLDHPLSMSQMAAVDTDDTHYASVAATLDYTSASAQPAFLFKVNNPDNVNSSWLDAQVIVKSSLPSSMKPIHLQVYRGESTNDWVTVASDNTTAADTDITFDPPLIMVNPSEYYFPESPGVTCSSSSTNCWTYWRVYQEAPDTSQNAVLYVDYVDIGYVAPTPSKISITNTERTMQHSVCNGAANVITVQLQDLNGFPANPSGTTVVRMSSDSTGETFYTDDTCSTTATNGDFTFATNENTKNVYMIDSEISGPTWTLSATRQSGDTLTSDSQSYTVLGPEKVVFTNPLRAFDLHICNGAANVFTIQLQDNTDTAITPTASTVIRVTSDSDDYTIYSDDTCETPVTNGDFTFTTSDTTKNFYIIERSEVAPRWTLTAEKQSGPETITEGTQEYNALSVSTGIRGGINIRGGANLR